MRRPVIAGNWKMYKTQAETRAFFEAFKPLVANATHCDIIIAPPFTSLSAAVDAARGSAISIAAQNCDWHARRRLHRRNFHAHDSRYRLAAA